MQFVPHDQAPAETARLFGARSGEGANFAAAGLWRPTEEWGAAYSMIMVDGCPQMAEVHDRMPVVLARESWQQWLAGTPAKAFALCQTCPNELAVDRTAERLGAGGSAATSG